MVVSQDKLNITFVHIVLKSISPNGLKAIAMANPRRLAQFGNARSDHRDRDDRFTPCQIII
jgi:hypothetical protein